MRSKLKLLVLCLVTVIPGPRAAASLPRLTPDNAIRIIYSHIKHMRYHTLKHYFRGKEADKLQKLLDRFQTDKSIYWELKKQTAGLDGYGIVKKEVYPDLAAITYYFIIKKSVPLKDKPHLHRLVRTKQFFEVMLVYNEKRWFAVASRTLHKG